MIVNFVFTALTPCLQHHPFIRGALCFASCAARHIVLVAGSA